MDWRRTGLLIAALVAVTLAAAPSAAAETEQGTTSTGDVDTYNLWGAEQADRCAFVAALIHHSVELTLHDTAPGDRVALSAQQDTIPADAAVATHEDPTVSVTVTGNDCDPPIEVAGLTVSGDLDYTVSRDNGPEVDDG
jgi:hypothetical protein